MRIARFVAMVIGYWTLMAGSASAIPFTVTTDHPKLGRITYSLDTMNADFFTEADGYTGTPMPPGVSGDIIQYSFRDIGVFAYDKSTGRFGGGYDWGMPWLTLPPLDTIKPCAAGDAGGVRSGFKRSGRISCFTADTVTSYFVKYRKSPRGWSCSRTRSSALCKRSSDGAAGRAVFLSPDAWASLKYAAPRYVQNCSINQVPRGRSTYVFGVGASSCSRINRNDLLMYVAEAKFLNRKPQRDMPGFSCRESSAGGSSYISCSDQLGSCIVFPMRQDGGLWFDSFSIDNSTQRFHYRTDQYAGC